MLVLSRKKGETVCIGDDIEITVVAVRGNRVKLAFAAPYHVSIRRTDLPTWPAAAPDMPAAAEPIPCR